jgi:hypothetical protein
MKSEQAIGALRAAMRLQQAIVEVIELGGRRKLSDGNVVATASLMEHDVAVVQRFIAALREG